MSLKEIQDLSALLFQTASKLNIPKFDLYGSRTEDSSVQVNAGKAQQMKSAQRTSITLRVWNHEGRSGVASTNDCSLLGLERSLAMARDSATFGNEPGEVDFSTLSKAPLQSKINDLPAESVSLSSQDDPSMQTMLANLLQCEAKVLAAEKRITSLTYNSLGYRNGERFYLNSQGALRWQPHHAASTYLYSRTEEQGKKTRSAGVQQVAATFAEIDLHELGQKLVETTRTFLDYKQIKSGSKLVVFSADAFLSLLSAFSNMFNAQDVLDQQSLSSIESLHKSICSNLLSVSDDPLNKHCVSSDFFDSEGTPTQRTNLIDKGTLISFLHSSVTSKKMNLPNTGNGVMGSKVRVSPHFWVVDGGISSEIERNIWTEPEIVWIDEVKSIHAGVNATQGSFSLPFSGWIVENGVRTSIESATVAGDFLSLLNSICYVEKEKEHTPDGVCPRVWVQGLSITSESEP